jgi:hypothetical protein
MKKIIFVLLICLMPALSFAAQISPTIVKSNFAKNEEFLVKIYIDTQKVSINAIEGELSYPAELIELKEIRDGNSVVNFWLEKPQSTKDGIIYFSGITPGGFYGDKIFLFEVIFKATNEGSGGIDFNSIVALENDGQATKIETSIMPQPFVISGVISEEEKKSLAVEGDVTAPEDFTPLVGKDPTIFEGKYFIAWSTVDKGSGIDHYEIREGFASHYTPAETPYLLKDQSLSTVIYIKAIDKAGNERIVRVNPTNPPYGLDPWVILGTILGIWIVIYAWKRLRPRFSSSR